MWAVTMGIMDVQPLHAEKKSASQVVEGYAGAGDRYVVEVAMLKNGCNVAAAS